MPVRLAVPIALVLVLAALVPSAAGAVPCPPLQCGPTTAAVADGRLLAVTAGTSRSTVIHDFATGKARSVITGGIVSANGRRAVGLDGGVLRTYDLARLRVVARKTVSAGWELAGLSADGRRTVLVRHTGTSKTTFTVLGPRAATATFEGKFDFDGLHGDRLYAIQQQGDGYLVRVADLKTGLLDAEPLKDADEPALIEGIAWSRLESPDGRYVFTLYIENAGDVMIHELDMQAGTATCIDLPGKSDFLAAGSYALALARDGRTLYAASGANGTVVTVDVRAKKVAKVARVAAAQTDMSGGQLLPSASLSRDGARLAFAVNGMLWVYDLAHGQLLRKTRTSIGAVAYSRTGVLWIAGPDGTVQRMQA